MQKTHFITSVLLLFTVLAFAQFHTLNIPQSSPEVHETQKLGVTNITINYSSPSVRGREIWNNPRVIPQEGNPIPWRAGANMNTTITFSTDVMIEGQLLKAGKYGFHVIPKGSTYTLLFAHNNNQWGSYYLDIDQDVTLSINVKSVESPFSEQMDFEFLNRTENSLVIGLEWGKRRLPFKVEVDLNTTIVSSFRSELRGINTYHWQAWNDAANWCLNHNTNLEEALQWVDRSINGGYGGFAANKNFTNLTTKLMILKKLNKIDFFKDVLNEISSVEYTPTEAHRLGRTLLYEQEFQESLNFTQKAAKKYPDVWFIMVNESLAKYFLKDVDGAIKDINKLIPLSPEQYHQRFNTVIEEMKAGTYKIPH